MSILFGCIEQEFLFVDSLVHPIDPLNDRDNPLRAKLSLSIGHHTSKQLFPQGSPRQHDNIIVFASFHNINSHSQILNLVLCKPTWSEIPFNHSLPKYLQRFRTRSTISDTLHELLQIQPRVFRENQTLAQPNQIRADRYLVRDLAALPAPRGAHVGFLPQDREDRVEPLHHVFLPRREDRQSAVARADIAAGDGGVDSPGTEFAGLRGDCAGELRVGAGGVDGDGVGAEGREDGVKEDGADIGGVAHHGEENVGELGQLGRGLGLGGTSGLKSEGVGVGGVTGVEGETVPRRQKARGHGKAHYADSDPPDSGFGWRNRVRVQRSHSGSSGE